MYTRHLPSFPILFKNYWSHFLWYVAYVSLIYFAYNHLGWERLDIKMSIATVLGFAVALLLGFRTSAAYERWWEARKIWGGIVNDSRSLVRQMIGYSKDGEINENVIQVARYQIAWCYSLRNSLRKLDPALDVEQRFSADKWADLRKSKNVPNEILKLISLRLQSMHSAGQIDSMQLISLDSTLCKLTDHMGKAERIKNTVFPTQYQSYTHLGVLIFLIMLPYGMLLSTGPFVIIICLLVSFIFLMLEMIATFLTGSL